MILISVRAFFISSWVTFGLSLDVLTGFDSGVHWIGMAQVLRYVGPYIVLYFFSGCWVQIHPIQIHYVLAFDLAAVLLTTRGLIARYKIHSGSRVCSM